MSILFTGLTHFELERRVWCLRKHNQIILQELTTIINENTDLEKKLRIRVENLEEGFKRLDGNGGSEIKH